MKSVALVGNPNSGKTTLFNLLTGSNQTIGNWPGVTVEKKSGKLKTNANITIQDLPGTYSLSPYSIEERVTRNFIISQQPDLVVDVVDSTNLERNLYLTLQLMETGTPLVLAMNMMDIAEKSGKKINISKLSYLLSIKVVWISALKKRNIHKLEKEIESNQPEYTYPEYDERLESALNMIQDTIRDVVPADSLRWYAIKLFECDEQINNELQLSEKKKNEITEIIATAEEIFGESSDSIIVNARYDFISKIIEMAVISTDDFKASLSDKLDIILTNRFFALPIFVMVMWLIYYLSIQTIGTMGSDWVNDVLFGEWIPNYATSVLKSLQVAGWMQGLIVDGIINGMGSILGFVPQIMMLFLCLGILEDCGYMARIAFVMDRIFHKFNLSGKSFIPMLISTGCGVPGIMATRTIENEKDRKMTIMLTTFMPCSAKLTVIALISGTFFPNESWVAPSAYFMGMLAVVGSGIFLKKTKLFSGPPLPFVMELPAYHFPRAANVLNQVINRANGFIKKAGTIIFASCVMIWFLSNFNFKLQVVSQSKSMLKFFGTILSPLFAPLGFGDWRATVAVLAGLIAKENCVGTLRIAFGGGTATAFTESLRGTYSAMAGYSFLAFNLLCAPCFAAIGTMYKEYGDAKWTLKAVGYQTSVAYLVALLIFQSYRSINNDSWQAIAVVLMVTAIFAYCLVIKKDKEEQMFEVQEEMKGSTIV
ncbi:ferrous iron transport protein B [Liquorilactobacillus mali]|uniref:Ferrous iron transport protein B n=2 Tax=Liquorilactobacillus mali TaxID=1618 RepID=A0A0R2E1A6_9LACO|nr:ferrous iron transport protein B [Liquorilactobacillus mali]KRN10078.1 ferrous iron transport protein B [Liquorilactobacillus mali KCTC 3596 = DSM 20444]MDC7953877.1 ferrous iron transport protein B [Liquorilactobacillus mali]MDV7758022.1 ferrous iron transport protein B [Liquorilactobacillus mali]QFQ75221.1 ferrous iron transport protein B [Liquorilactobacillus mali]